MRAPAILTLFICLLLAATAHAQPRCGPSVAVLLGLGRLGETEHETLVRPAQDGSGDVRWAMWLNKATGSWTLTGTQGVLMCVFRGGLSNYGGWSIRDFLDGPAT